MSNSYIKTPESISLNEIIENNFSLSSFQYQRVSFKNKNFKCLGDLIKKPIRGFDQKAIDFVDKSSYFYLKTKAIRYDKFLIDTESQGCLEKIKPKAFLNTINSSRLLKKNDILYCSSGGEEIGDAAIVSDFYDKIVYSSHSFKVTPIDENIKYYLLSFLKSSFCKQQLSFLVYRGSTLRRGGDKFLQLKIPFPNFRAKETIDFTSLLTQAIINKEKLIKQRHQKILEKIENELKENQNPDNFKFDYPKINEIIEVGRLDTNLYSKKFKKIDFLIKNYKNGFQTIYDYGFTLSRGQNLQVSTIGTSIYSEKYYDNFYTLMLPKFLSKYGTVDTIEYLGNAKKLKTLEKGDLIFGAEGFEKGRSIVIIEEKEKTITNIHGITIQQHNKNLTTSIFIKCCLDYLRNKGLIDLFAVGGNGGSLAQKYWEYIPFPIFPDDKQKEIAKLYHNADLNYEISQCTLDDFLETDNAYNEKAGIYQLDKTAKQLKDKLNKVIDDIINDNDVVISFNLH